MKKHIGIIGGGAAGMMAAVTAARKGTKVTILERNDRIGKKILQTGNGRCNLTNLYYNDEMYNCDSVDFVHGIINQMPVEKTIEFFESMGIILKKNLIKDIMNIAKARILNQLYNMI